MKGKNADNSRLIPAPHTHTCGGRANWIGRKNKTKQNKNKKTKTTTKQNKKTKQNNKTEVNKHTTNILHTQQKSILIECFFFYFFEKAHIHLLTTDATKQHQLKVQNQITKQNHTIKHNPEASTAGENKNKNKKT